jgi:hypothetical protein
VPPEVTGSGTVHGAPRTPSETGSTGGPQPPLEAAHTADYERVPDDVPCPGTRVHEDWLKYLLEDGKKAVQHRDHWHVIPAAFKITGWLPDA